MNEIKQLKKIIKQKEENRKKIARKLSGNKMVSPSVLQGIFFSRAPLSGFGPNLLGDNPKIGQRRITRGEPRPNIVYTYFHVHFHYQVEDNR